MKKLPIGKMQCLVKYRGKTERLSERKSLCEKSKGKKRWIAAGCIGCAAVLCVAVFQFYTPAFQENGCYTILIEAKQAMGTILRKR